MATPGGVGRKRPLAPALRTRSVWAVEVVICDHAHMQVLRAAAEQLFLRGRQGGTEGGVALIICLPALGATGRAQLAGPQTSDAAASSSRAPLVLAASAQAGEPSARNALHPRLQVCMVFETARRKSSVKRTAQDLLSPMPGGKECVESSLSPVTFTAILSRLSSQVATFALPRFKDNIVEYLSGRTIEDLDAPEPMDMTSDLMGPIVTRQRLLLRAGSEKAAHVDAAIAADDQSDQADLVPVGEIAARTFFPHFPDQLEELLSWGNGDLSATMAAERASALLDIIRKQTEELAVAKAENNYLKWQESLRAEVTA